MRPMTDELRKKLALPVQAGATGSAPSVGMLVCRKQTPLIYDNLLEKLTVKTGVTKAAVAVRHMVFGQSADAVFIAYVANDMVSVISAYAEEAMAKHSFAKDGGLLAPASDTAIAFDGTMPHNDRGVSEFITEPYPWVFWVNLGGAVYGRRLDMDQALVLAEKNATAVSAVRAIWSEVDGFDFGLCLFMILSGAVYCRQLIGGVWYDAEPIPAAALPTLEVGAVWVQIAASRTWDYRVVLQLADSLGNIYEVFTQYGGIGSKNAEHIEIRDIKAAGKLTRIDYRDAQNAGEHIEIADVRADSFLWSTVTPAEGVLAANMDDGSGDWGRFVEIELNEPVMASTLSGQAGQIKLTDSRNRVFTAIGVTASRDGRTLAAEFSNFNAAYGTCDIAYTPGTVASGVLAMTDWSVSFTPERLVPPLVDPPEVTEVINI